MAHSGAAALSARIVPHVTVANARPADTAEADFKTDVDTSQRTGRRDPQNPSLAALDPPWKMHEKLLRPQGVDFAQQNRRPAVGD